MTKWEYHIESMNPYGDRAKLLNELGAKGWENYAVLQYKDSPYYFYYFKRPLPEPTTGIEKEQIAFVPCFGDDPECCGSFTSKDGTGLAYVKEIKL